MSGMANSIEVLRKARGLSQERLARVADVSTATVDRMEKGRSVTLDNARAIAAALEVGLDEALAPPKEAVEEVAS